MIFSFIHMADVHFDTPFASKDPDFRRFMRESTRLAFKAGVDLALREKVNAFLIAGDLFDNNTLSFATERFLTEQLNRLKDASINVYYSPGNHDPWGSSFRLGRISLPPNVHIFKTSEPETVPVVDVGGRTLALITGAGHEGNREGRNLAKLFPKRTSRDLPHIGLLHTMVTGTGGGEHERYAPSTLLDLVHKDYTYWALGHVHVRSVLSQNPMVVYSGNLIGRNSRETGPKGAYLVKIGADGRPRPTFHALAPVYRHDLAVGNLEEIGDLESLESELFNAITDYFDKKTQPGDPLLKLILEGPTPLFAELTNPEDQLTLTNLLKESLNLRFLEISARNLVRRTDPKLYREGPHVLSEVLSLLDTLKAGTPKDAASSEAPPGVRAMQRGVQEKGVRGKKAPEEGAPEATIAPTERPMESPTAAPTERPMESPTAAPTEKPMESPDAVADLLLKLAPEGFADKGRGLSKKRGLKKEQEVRYLRSLLEGLEYEAVARLVDGDEG